MHSRPVADDPEPAEPAAPPPAGHHRVPVRPEAHGAAARFRVPVRPEAHGAAARFRVPVRPEAHGAAARLCVPVRPGPHGATARLFRTPLGARTAVAFTRPGPLRATLGPDQPWITLAEPALRALVQPLGVHLLTVDPVLTAPFTPAAGRSGPAGPERPAARTLRETAR